MSLRIAVVQQSGNAGRVAENRRKAVGFAREALRRRADLILFQEALLTQYAPNLRALAEPADGPTTQAFRRLLRGSKARVLYGLVERDGPRLFTSAVLVGAGGVEAAYRKTHLWWRARGLRREIAIFQPGDRLVTFEIKGHRCGIMICYDGDFPEMTRSYANLGCAMLFWLNNRGSRGPEEVRPLAVGNSMIFAAACCCGPDEGDNLCRGGSNIADEHGVLLAEIWDREGVIVANVHPERVPAARRRNPWYRGRRPDLYR